MKKFLAFICIALLSGCAANTQSSTAETKPSKAMESSTMKETATKTVAEESTEPEEIPLPENAISISNASRLLLQKLKNYGYNTKPNQHLVHESTGTLNIEYNYTDSLCEYPLYLFRAYDDFSEHQVTTGWYAVDPRTGECFDTNANTKLSPLFYRFEITESGVEVYEKSGEEPLQILTLDPELTADPEWLYKTYQEGSYTPYRFVSMQDYDFDGYEDIRIQNYLGAYQGTNQYYRFNPDTKMFENWDELNELHFTINVHIDDESLSVFSKSGAVDSWNYTYKWNDDKLMLISLNKRYYSYTDKKIYHDLLEYDAYGNETLVNREIYNNSPTE